MIEVGRDLVAAISRWRTWLLMGNQDIQMRYRRSVFGPFWISLSLAALVLALALLYGQIFEQDFIVYLHWLMSGFLVWFLFSTMVIEGCSIGIEAEGQLRSISIPLSVLGARMVYRNWIVFLHNLLVVAAFFLLFKLPITLNLLWVIPGIMIVLATGFFLSMITGPLCLRFRDVNQVVINVLQIAFFLTPILWMPDQGRVASSVVHMNPLYHLVELVRAPLLGHAPTAANWLYAEITLGVTIVLALIALQTSRKSIYLWL